MNIIYDNSVGKAILKLEETSMAKVVRTIALLEKFGEELRMPHSKKITSKLFELRIKGKQEIRIFYTFLNKNTILLHLFIKKSQKTPPNEIATAQRKLANLD